MADQPEKPEENEAANEAEETAEEATEEATESADEAGAEAEAAAEDQPAAEQAEAAPQEGRTSRVANIAFWLLLIGVALIALSPATLRLNLLDWTTALGLAPAGAVITVLAVLMGIIGMFTTRNAGGRSKARAALLGGVLVIGTIALNVMPYMNFPAIHDITTDMDNAPAFVALRDARDAAPNSTDYAGADVADVQREHYPNLKTMVSQHSGNAVFSAAEEVAQSMGWEIAAAVPAEGRIEATATTKIYGFKDDVVIRVQPTMDGTTIVDVRSASRVGQGDLGANAIRIKIFLHTLETKLAG